MPLWLQGLAVVVLGDVLVYWFHRACHTFGPLWRIHAIHHSAESLDWLAAHREHPLDGVLTQLCANLPAMLMGFDVFQLSALAAFRGMWSIFIHSNVRVPLGPLRWLFGAPELHHWHHARDERVNHNGSLLAPPGANYANTAPWLDVLFGTHHVPDRTDYALGLREPIPGGYFAQLWYPFRCLASGGARKDPLAPGRGQRRPMVRAGTRWMGRLGAGKRGGAEPLR